MGTGCTGSRWAGGTGGAATMAGPHHGTTRRSRRQAPAGPGDATPLGGALCCDATLVSPLTRSGQPQPCAAESDGAALRVAERRKHATYPLSAAPQRQLGRDGGVVCWQWLCSRQLPAQRWAHMDRSWQRAVRETRLARTWTSCCTSRQRRGLAACRCGRRRAS